MCRAVMYLGEAALLDDFLFKTDCSLIKQTYLHRYMSVFNNLAGFGIAAWSDLNPETTPYIYRTENLPFYDRNLKQLAVNTNAKCLVAHVRGTFLTETSVVSEQNVHPFIFPNYKYALAHNGNLHDITEMKLDLIKKMRPEIAVKIQGTTDSELVYALLMSQLPDPTVDYPIEEMIEKTITTIKIIRDVRYKHHIQEASPLNLFITNGQYIIATRFVFDFGNFLQELNKDYYGYHSLWYTFGDRYCYLDNEYKMKFSNEIKSIIIASEPLTYDVTTWFEVPEYFIIGASIEDGQLNITKKYIDA